MKKAFPKLKMPADLDVAAKKKFRELAAACDEDVDQELLGNFCRMYGSLVSIRKERARQEATGAFELMVPGRDGTEVLNPLETQQTRLIASMNKALKGLGLSPERVSGRATPAPNPPPPGFPRDAKEPEWGWNLERELCGPDEDLPGGKKWPKQ